MKGNPQIGEIVGRGVAINVELGWVPHYVELYNGTDGDLITAAFLRECMAFTSGGTAEILPGDKVIGVTSRAEAYVESVLLASGSFGGGDAAGFLVLADDKRKGTFGSENVSIGANADAATVTANFVTNVATAAAAASASGTSAMSRYEGTGTSPKGFTIGSVIAEAGKLLRYIAYRNDD